MAKKIKLTMRCPKCRYAGKGSRQHRAHMEAPGLIFPTTVMECGRCGHVSEAVWTNGTTWFDKDQIEKTFKTPFTEWCKAREEKGQGK